MLMRESGVFGEADRRASGAAPGLMRAGSHDSLNEDPDSPGVGAGASAGAGSPLGSLPENAMSPMSLDSMRYASSPPGASNSGPFSGGAMPPDGEFGRGPPHHHQRGSMGSYDGGGVSLGSLPPPPAGRIPSMAQDAPPELLAGRAVGLSVAEPPQQHRASLPVMPPDAGAGGAQFELAPVAGAADEHPHREGAHVEDMLPLDALSDALAAAMQDPGSPEQSRSAAPAPAPHLPPDPSGHGN
jgi:hypothetical protein